MDSNLKIYDTPEYKRSRSAYLIECAFEYFVALLVTDAFLANILKSIGFSDEATGVMSSIISLAFLFQLFSVLIIRKITNTKAVAIAFHSVSQIFFMSLYLVPFLPSVPDSAKQVITVVCLLLAYFGNYMVSNLIYRWGNSYVDPNKRGRYSAGKEIVSLFAGMIVSLVIAYVMDIFEANGNTKGSFIFAAVGILVFSIADFAMLMTIKNDKKPKGEKGSNASMSEVMKNTLGNKNFRHIVILMILWDAGRYFTIGFLGTYKIVDLGYSLAMSQVINLVSVIVRILASRPFGKFADKYSFAKGAKLGLLVALIAFVFGMFSTPETRFFIVIYTVLYNAALGGIVGNLVNITYSYVDSKYFAEASAIKNSIAGVLGFIASLVGGKILSAVQANGNQLLGKTVYGQQILFVISAAFMIAAIVYTRLVITKQEVMKQ